VIEHLSPGWPESPLCAREGRVSVIGSHYRRVRGREDRANRQPALLPGRGMT
jgi:hypothetical protein